MKGSQRAHDSLVRACRDLLEFYGVPAFRVQQKASQRRDGSWYAGSDKGAPDIFACVHGAAWAIECKTGAARMTPEQRSAADLWIKAGGVWVVVRSIDELGVSVGAAEAPHAVGTRAGRSRARILARPLRPGGA